MSNQDKIRYLKQYQTNEREITRLQEELKRWESKACKVTAGFNAAPSSGGGADKVQNCVEKILEVKDKIVAQIMQGATLRINIDHAINSVPDERLRQLLNYRYIDGMTWERIAVTMDYSWRQTCRMHGKALDMLKMS